ncbi:NAD(P)-dependent oxidoreductase [Bacteroides zhangwenhongii]|uniref:NAD(P)-dependent oxidoreductase n=1 Tax=Bacteroides zhangwenhongii TaxID=2650157 RepID=A0ABT5HBT6_9BACE|nr:NAD(P)-dependent oxidoreductase [Bacteroides zhangwenhongii]MDC7138046.1 NAD(P)-dependent oxidoreductase [Bacteroides zhangwenhongii]
MKAKTVLLTGGNGFIGRNVCESYLMDKYNILSPSSLELNLADEEKVAEYFLHHSIDVVIHAAVKPSHRNAKDFSDIFYTNTRMFFNLERYKAQFEKMLVIGSGAIYDSRNYRPKMKEDSWIDHIPVDEHGYCKYVCEKVISHSANIFDLRVFGIFGKYEDYAIRFISNAICKVLFDLPITIKQNRKFDYLYVDDLMPILDWFIQNDPKYKAYNITPDCSVSLYDLAVMIREIAGKPTHPIIVAQEGMGLEYSGDNSRLKKECKFGLTPLTEAIHHLYVWYSDNREQVEKDNLLIDK